MNNNEGNISIERFAAFLDGNLPEKEMQDVADIIDSDRNYMDVVSATIDIDNMVEVIADDTNVLPEELCDMDFEFPVIPAFDSINGEVEILPVLDETEVVAVEPGAGQFDSFPDVEDESEHQSQVHASPTGLYQDAEIPDAYNNATDNIYENHIINTDTIDII